MRKPGIKDIAKAMNLSPAAVSYALSNKGRVSPETRRSVERIAKEIGFIRDDTAVRLRTGRSRLLGVIVNDMSNPYFAELLSDFEDAARDEGYLTMFANSRDNTELQEQLISSFLSQGIAGLLICPANGTTAEALASITNRQKPTVLCVRDIKDAEASFVGQDDVLAGQIAANHLIENDLRHIAYVGGLSNTKTHRDRLKGIRRAFKKLGMSLPREMVLPGKPDSASGEAITAELLGQHRLCEAIIAFNDYVAIGAYSAIQASGRKVGQDISVVGFDNIPIGSALMPPLTTVELHPRTIGKKSAEALISSLSPEPDLRPSRLLIEPRLIVRKSTARKRLS